MMENTQLATTEQNPNVEIAQFDENMLRSFVGANNFNLTEKEFMQFIEVCRAFNLNPFKKEIYIQKFGNNFALIVGYQTYIKRAEGTGKLDGWNVEISDDNETATITIHRKDFSKPFKWEVDKAEFYKGTGPDKRDNTWNTSPRFMLKKVAIAQGFRLCFPSEVGGMPYTQEENDSIQNQEERVEATVIPSDAFEAPREEKIEEEKAPVQAGNNDEQERVELKELFQRKARAKNHNLMELNEEIKKDWNEGGIPALSTDEIKKIAKYYSIEL